MKVTKATAAVRAKKTAQKQLRLTEAEFSRVRELREEVEEQADCVYCNGGLDGIRENENGNPLLELIELIREGAVPVTKETLALPRMIGTTPRKVSFGCQTGHVRALVEALVDELQITHPAEEVTR